MREELIETIGNGFTAFYRFFSNIFVEFGSWFMDTPFGKILSFIWSMIEFVFYAVKSIVNLIRNVLYSLFDGSLTLYGYLLDTFENLSLYLGKPTALLLSMFVIVLLLLVFQFLVRLLSGKYHITKGH